jgi:hypothetical protein
LWVEESGIEGDDIAETWDSWALAQAESFVSELQRDVEDELGDSTLSPQGVLSLEVDQGGDQGEDVGVSYPRDSDARLGVPAVGGGIGAGEVGGPSERQPDPTVRRCVGVAVGRVVLLW